MRTTELLCFGAVPGTGNPALVVQDGPADVQARQALARERNVTVVFIDGDTETVLDYWYPHARSPLCLHATLAAAAVLFERDESRATPAPDDNNPSPTADNNPSPTAHNNPPSTADNNPPSTHKNHPSSPRRRGPNFPGTAPTLAVTTAAGQPLAVSREGGDIYVQLGIRPVPAIAVLPDLAALLRQPGFVPASAPQVASVGSPKLLVEVPDTAALHALQPDLAAISAWGKAHAVNGIYAWCRHPDGRVEGRNFNHLDPALEDGATGVAAGALTALLGRGLTLLQGRASGHNCLIRTRIDGASILVGGCVSP